MLWDLPNGLKDVSQVKELSSKCGVAAGSINPNFFQEQEYKFGAVGNPDPAVRKQALGHLLDCRDRGAVEFSRRSTVFPDGSSYPGTQSMRRRIGWFEQILKTVHGALSPAQNADRVQTF